LTYGFGNTSIKAGRQELPKALSPFAYSEDWNVFKNTFDAVVVVNSDLPDTTLVGAWVYRNNKNGMHADMSAFNALNNHDGVFMLTAQNKSIENLTLTASWYFAKDMLDDVNNTKKEDLNILWADAQYDAGSFNVGLQGGTAKSDAFNPKDDIVAFGAKVGGKFNGVNVMAAYSNVNNGGGSLKGVFNVGGETSALYTDTAVNQLLVGNPLEVDANKFVVSAGVDALGGNILGAFAYTDSDENNTTKEFDLVYSTNVAGIDVTAAYVYLKADVPVNAKGKTKANLVRVVGSYNF